jgi:hypothetical protein
MNGILQNWKRRYQRMMRNHAEAREVEAMSATERSRLAEDMGMGGIDLRRLHCAHSGSEELMPRRLQQLGIDAAYVRQELPSTYRDLERVCARCKSARRCAGDLARGDVQAGMDGYCLNAPTIDALLLGQAEIMR